MFPIEIYERILEYVIDIAVDDVRMWKYTLKQFFFTAPRISRHRML